MFCDIHHRISIGLLRLILREKVDMEMTIKEINTQRKSRKKNQRVAEMEIGYFMQIKDRNSGRKREKEMKVR